jgi:hypothetical protein
VKGKVGGVAKAQAAHPPVGAAVGSAHAAAEAPSNDLNAQANTAKAGDMAAAKAEAFDKAKFVEKVLAKVTELTPQTGDDLDKFKSQGKAGQVKGAVKSDVGPAAGRSAAEVKSATDRPADLSKATPKPVTPLEQPNVPAPPPVNAAAAMPAPAPPAATDLSAGPKKVEEKMTENKVTDEQLKKGNEPQFDKATKAKGDLKAHAAKAPADVRKDEKLKLDAAKAAAAATSKTGLDALHATAADKHAGSHDKKLTAKQQEEADRQRIAGEINTKFEAAKTKVEGILTALDDAVNTVFDTEAGNAAAEFERDVERRKDKIKSDMPWDEWLESMIITPSPKLKDAYVQARAAYLESMKRVIGSVANVVDDHLRRAKEAIAEGQNEIAKYVAEQPKNLQKLAQEAATGLTEKFAELTQSVNDKQQDIIDKVAEKYVAARQAVDDKIKEMEEADKGLLDMAMDEINGVIETIIKLKEMLTSILKRAESAMDRIIADPIGFLQKLVEAVKSGFAAFGRNILTHLKTGFFEWLLGPIKEMGVDIPTEWNLQSIFKLVLQVIGVTWEQIKNKIMAKLPPPVAQILETGIEAIGAYQKGGAEGVKDLAMDKLPPQVKSVIEMVTRIRKGGIAELWKIIGEKIGDLKKMVIEKIKDFLIEKVIKAGIEWVISLCNPAGAFVKAVQLIIKIITFFVDNAAKIKAVVDKILDSVEDILDGGGKVAGMIEETLAKFIPMVIEFVANLLGFGGIGAKVQEIIKSVRGAIDKAIDWVIDKIFTALKWVWGKMKAGAKKVKGALTGKGKDKDKDKKKDPKSPETTNGTVLATSSTTVRGHSFKTEAVKQGSRVNVLIQRNTLSAPAAASAAANQETTAEVRTKLYALIARIDRVGQTKPDDVARLNTMMQTLTTADLAQAAEAHYAALQAGASTPGTLADYVKEFNDAGAIKGGRRKIYYEEPGSDWKRTTESTWARDLPQITRQVLSITDSWAKSNRRWVEPSDNFADDVDRQLHSSIHVQGERAGDFTRQGMPKYVPNHAYEPFMVQIRYAERQDRAALDRLDDEIRSNPRAAQGRADLLAKIRSGRIAARDALIAAMKGDPGKWGVDHQTPLAQHWSGHGHSGTAEERARIHSGPANLTLVSGLWNSTKGGEDADFTTPPAAGFARRPGEQPVTATPPAGGAAGGLFPPP